MNQTADYHSHEARKSPWIIQDWAGNIMDYGRFASFEDAEEYLG